MDERKRMDMARWLLSWKTGFLVFWRPFVVCHAIHGGRTNETKLCGDHTEWEFLLVTGTATIAGANMRK